MGGGGGRFLRSMVEPQGGVGGVRNGEIEALVGVLSDAVGKFHVKQTNYFLGHWALGAGGK